MANSARNQPGAERPVTSQEEPDINPMDNITVWYEKNKKPLTTAITVIFVAAAAFIAYQKLYKGPGEEKAASSMAMPQLYFQVDSLNLALNGDGKNMGFEKIAKKYSGTAAGNIALYYEGICYLKMGDYKKAIKALGEFDGKGTILAYQAWGSLGLAYMEAGEKEKAIDNFKKATANKEDALITPMYLYQLGLAYRMTGKTKEAIEVFRRIRDEYPRSINARDMDKELALLGDIE